MSVRSIFAFCLLLCFSGPVLAGVEPYDLTVEYMSAPVGIDSPKPRLSWKSKAVEPNLKNVDQTAYRVLVASSLDALEQNRGDLWDSGKVESDQSLNIEYAGKALITSQRCYWKVQTWYKADDSKSGGKALEKAFESKASSWIMGVMRPEDWKAKWIGVDDSKEQNESAEQFAKIPWIWPGETLPTINLQTLEKPAGRYYFRKEFDLQKKKPNPEKVEDRYLSEKNLFTAPEIPRDFLMGHIILTADDKYDLYVNGHKITEPWGHIFDWKLVRVFQIAQYLKVGKNVIGVCVINDTPGPIGLIAQINNIAAEGNGEFTSDSSWLWSEKATENWNTNTGDFDATGWKSSVEVKQSDFKPWSELITKYLFSSFLSPRFDKEFSVKKPVKTATLHISGLGFYEAKLNGKKIGNKVLDPIPTRYDKRVLYSTYDLSKELREGDNKLLVDLGNGWFNVQTVSVWNFDIAPWRDLPKLLAQLEIEYADGTKDFIVTNEKWVTRPSVTVYNCIRQGEQIWGLSQRELSKVENEAPKDVLVVSAPKGKLCAANMPASVVAEEIKPVKITEPNPGIFVADFGQNTAGWVRLTVKKPKTWDFVRIKYAERLAKDGRIDQVPIDMFFKQGNVRFPFIEEGQFQTDVFTPMLGNEGDENKNYVFEPRFVYHGFQYVEIVGLSEPLQAEDIVACVVHTDFKKAGHFECSNELFNKIQNATLWSYRGNYVNGYPTDCPHREKNGWTGDAHLAAEQAMYNWDNTAGYEKWIRDLLDEQQPDGNLPGIVPTSGWGYAWGNGPAWDSALVLIPWYLYEYKGDKRILEESYDAMKKYVDFLTSREKPSGLIDHGLGDWCFAKTETPTVVTSSVYYYVDAKIVAKVAKILGKDADAEKYHKLSEKIKTAYTKELLKDDGTDAGIIANGSQTAQSFALVNGLLDDQSDALKKQIAEKMFEAVEKADNHLDFGILGAKTLFECLSGNARTDLALKILNQTTAPSYGDWLARGATTLWEDWGDGSSRNHVMYGDVSRWFYQELGGIAAPEDIAFKKSLLKLEFPEGIDWAKTEHDSPYGPIKVQWKRDNQKILVDVSVPVNTSATTEFRGDSVKHRIFGSGDYRFEIDK